MMLPTEVFKNVIKHAPLFAVDLVVVNENHELLVGKRINEPAKSYWFVPGGRVFKNENLNDAFSRITQAELGISLCKDEFDLLGIYEHFYPNNFIDDLESTHYINATHVLKIKRLDLVLPDEQHSDYRWVPISKIENDDTIHKYSKVFLDALELWIAASEG